MTCICNKPIPRKRMGWLSNEAGIALSNFHMDCPEHGIVVTWGPPWIPVAKSNWVTAQEMINAVAFYRSKEGLRYTQVSPDGTQLLLEWIEWEPPAQGESV